jgi:hypothetical protein
MQIVIVDVLFLIEIWRLIKYIILINFGNSGIAFYDST